MLTVLVVAACAAGEELADDTLAPSRDGGFAATGSQGVAGSGAGSGAGEATTTDGVGGGGSSVATAGTTTGGTSGSANAAGATAAGGATAQGSGGAGTSGSAGAVAGRSGVGGAAVSDAGAGEATTACGVEQKVCNGQCVVPSVSVGCGLLGCAPCPVGPSHSVTTCTGTQCDFECSPGYARNGGTCVPNDGGAGGGSGDASTSDAGQVICGGSVCSGCMPFIQEACCKTNNTCGCHYPFAPCM